MAEHRVHPSCKIAYAPPAHAAPTAYAPLCLPPQRALRQLCTRIGVLLLLYLIANAVISGVLTTAAVLLNITVSAGLEQALAQVNDLLSDPLILYGVTLVSAVASAAIVFVPGARWLGVRPRALFAGKTRAYHVFNGWACVLLINLVFSLLTQIVLAILEEAAGVTPYIPFTEADPSDPFGTAVMVVYAVAAAPVIEEFIFRGVLLQPLRRYGDWFAILATSLLFSLLHGNLSQIPAAFCIGLCFGFLAVKSGTLLPCMLVHALNNAVATCSTLFESASMPGILLLMDLLMLALAVYALVMLFVYRDQGALARGMLRGGQKLGALLGNASIPIFIALMLASTLATLIPV